MADMWHLTEARTWAAAQETGSYTGSTRGAGLDDVGFIHCSYSHQLTAVAGAVYGDVTGDFVLLELDRGALEAAGSAVREEPGNPRDPDSPLFPHIYGPIPVAAVRRVIPARVERGVLTQPVSDL